MNPSKQCVIRHKLINKSPKILKEAISHYFKYIWVPESVTKSYCTMHKNNIIIMYFIKAVNLSFIWVEGLLPVRA